MSENKFRKWARRNGSSLADLPDADTEKGILDAFKLVHEEARIPEIKRAKLREIERTVVKLFLARRAEKTRRPISFEHGLAILQGHRRDAEEVYSTIGRDKWFDSHHRLPPTSRAQFLADVDTAIADTDKDKLAGTFPHISSFEPNFYSEVSRFNELATMAHLGRDGYERYDKARKAFISEVRRVSGYTIN